MVVPGQVGGARALMVVEPHPILLTRSNLKKFNKFKENEVIKTSEEAYNRPIWGNE